jgi:hypothetical protein
MQKQIAAREKLFLNHDHLQMEDVMVIKRKKKKWYQRIEDTKKILTESLQCLEIKKEKAPSKNNIIGDTILELWTVSICASIPN